MKKIVSIVGVMVALVLSLTGCMKMDVDVQVSSPEKGSVTTVVGVEKKLLGGQSLDAVLAQTGATEEQLMGQLPEGVTKTPFEDAEFLGYKFAATDKSLTELNDMSAQIGVKFEIEFRDGLYFFSSTGFGGTDVSTLSESTLTVTFPGVVTEASAAGEISGNTVTFDLKNTEGELTATAKEADNTALLLSGAFGILALIGAAVGVAIMRRPEVSEAH
ncbi:hypothetical protein CQ018_10035 [Arthrobacter sp. MYb227]|uniref:LppM family (lipo)protein n=1 Tax=Arthrobacter sp. MYb227 TaxID=1848601 RepID=UPI000CFA9757|nr:hypothetical protein [Arthrobacter sp. MYb227]PQZ92815.1 hypothetical protein CQ018_10035 [Arthrobacter sp. MYb227]